MATDQTTIGARSVGRFDVESRSRCGQIASNVWKLIDANLLQIRAYLAECVNILQVMEKSPEKEQAMKPVAKTAINVLEQLAASVTTAALSARRTGFK
jgi:hypothetical protein